MKHGVVSTGLQDAHIRPQALLDEFKRLSIEDAARCFLEPEALEPAPCPGCASAKGDPAFTKDGFRYEVCPKCRSVFVSPRPTADALADYYENSRASLFRIAEFEPKTASARRRHVLQQNAQWMGRLVDESGLARPLSWFDAGSHGTALFEEISALGAFDSIQALDPLPGLETALSDAGIGVVGDSGNLFSAASAFEQLEHQHEPLAFLRDLGTRLTTNGLLFFTTRTIDGFDLQMLGGKAPYIFVPEHLNLLSIEGIEILLQRAGFEIIELSTPGQLDVELTRHAVQADSSIQLPDFIRTLIDERGDAARGEFQAFLQKHRLSSHLRVAARKTGDPEPRE